MLIYLEHAYAELQERRAAEGQTTISTPRS